MAAIKGMTVNLLVAVQTGVDAFDAPVYTETEEVAPNVLICPVGSQDVVSDLQLYGRRTEYELHIPKEDAHTWEHQRVRFFGETWETVGKPVCYMSHLVPLDWDRKVRVAKYE